MVTIVIKINETTIPATTTDKVINPAVSGKAALPTLLAFLAVNAVADTELDELNGVKSEPVL